MSQFEGGDPLSSEDAGSPDLTTSFQHPSALLLLLEMMKPVSACGSRGPLLISKVLLCFQCKSHALEAFLRLEGTDSATWFTGFIFSVSFLDAGYVLENLKCISKIYNRSECTVVRVGEVPDTLSLRLTLWRPLKS